MDSENLTEEEIRKWRATPPHALNRKFNAIRITDVLLAIIDELRKGENHEETITGRSI